MKILHLSTNDISGGAARAAHRVHSALNKYGVDSYMLVQKKSSDNLSVIGPHDDFKKFYESFKSKLDQFPLKVIHTKQSGPWSLNWFPTGMNRRIEEIDPDIVNLHWIGNGMISIRDLGEIKKPIVWTMHDMWPFAGGFHYSEKFVNHDNSIISRYILSQKIKYWNKLHIWPVSPSKWLAKVAKESKLFHNMDVSVIPNCIDTNLYQPINKNAAAMSLNLDPRRKYILFGAMSATSDERKGFQFLQPALNELKKLLDTKDTSLLIFGNAQLKSEVQFELESHYLGHVSDERKLAAIYSLADVSVVPSTIDNFPNVILESLSCGTPCVAFNVGGIPDLIIHKTNGYLASPFDINDLAKGLGYSLFNAAELSKNARKNVLANYSEEIIASEYHRLYKKTLNINAG